MLRLRIVIGHLNCYDYCFYLHISSPIETTERNQTAVTEMDLLNKDGKLLLISTVTSSYKKSFWTGPLFPVLLWRLMSTNVLQICFRGFQRNNKILDGLGYVASFVSTTRYVLTLKQGKNKLLATSCLCLKNKVL